MFLRNFQWPLGAFLAACVLVSSSRAAADAQQCVQQSNDGAELRDRHQLLAAREAYQACVADDNCPAVVRAECDSALEELRTMIPTLLVALRDGQGHELLGGTVWLDGKPVALDGSSLEVDPGAHELTAESGTSRSQVQVMAIERNTNWRIEMLLQPVNPTAQCATPAAMGAARPLPSAPSPETSPATSAPTTQRSLLPAYVLAGVAALGMTSFGYFALSGHSEMQQLDACKPACDPSEVTRVRAKYLTADLSLGVSLMALGGAGYWLFSAPKETPSAAVKPFSLAITATPSVAALSLQWVQ